MILGLLLISIGLVGIFITLSTIRSSRQIWHVEWGDMILGANQIWRPGPALTDYLADGWEPFATSTVMWQIPGEVAPKYTERVYLRKKFSKVSAPA